MSWEVRLLGSLSAARGDEVITHFRTQKTAALLAFLAFRAGIPQSREEIVERFWPDAEPEQGRMSLRTALSSLRKILDDTLSSDYTTAMLSVNTDHARFERALRAARGEKLPEPERLEKLAEAVEIYGGPLLPGFYDDWVLRERDRLAAAQVAALSALAHWHAGLGEMQRGLDYARRASAADPLNEEIRADLIRLLRKTNRPGEALRQYQDLETLLSEQLGEIPSAATTALVEGLSADNEAPEPVSIVRLPLTLGRFRGRRDQLSTLVQRLSGGKNDAEGARLFTLFGPGGIGKTRLAIEVARRLGAHHFFSALHFVPLASVSTLEESWGGLARALGLSGNELPGRIKGYLTNHSPALLVIDNLEQALPLAAALIETLLNEVPGLMVLATSRQRLAIPGEELFAVGALAQEDAVALFVDRARAVDPDFRLTSRNESQIQKLTTLLEGFPLSIELVATWVGVLTLDEISQQLAQSRLSLPEDAKKGARHASLHAAITWSTALLEPELRQTFYRLSVFQGGWDALAAQAVCGASHFALANLRDRALVYTELIGTSLRFFLHESLRQFGTLSLEASEQVRLEGQHTSHFLERAEEAHLDRPRDGAWAAALARLIPDEANLRIARERATFSDKVRFVLALTPLWLHQGHFIEGELACQEVAAELVPEQPSYLPLRLAAAIIAYNRNENTSAESGLREVAERGEGVVRTRALLSLAQLALFNLDDAEAAHRWLAAIEDFTPILAAQARFLEGTALLYRGEALAAATVLAGAAAEASEAGELALAAQALNNQGNALHQVGELGSAHQSYTRALELREELGLRVETLRTRVGLANVAVARGDLPSALRIFRQAGQDAAAMGDLHTEAVALGNEAAVLQEQGKSEESLVVARQSLRRRQQLGLTGSIATSLNNIAGNLLSLGKAESAALLHGAAEAVRRKAGITLGPAFLQQLEVEQEKVRQQLGEPAYTDHFAKGACLTEPEAIALALSASPVTQLSR